MALTDASNLAQIASVLVAGLAVVMATLGYKSYRTTGNRRLAFIVVTFGLFAFKGLFAAYNLRAHDLGSSGIPHDTLELLLALFDLFIVALLFVPFILVRSRA